MSKKHSKKNEIDTSVHEETEVLEDKVETEVVDVDVEAEGVHQHIHVEKSIEEKIEIVESDNKVTLIEIEQPTEYQVPQKNSLSITDEINAVIKLLEYEHDYESAAQLHGLLTKLGEVKVYLNFIESNVPRKAKHLIEKIISNL